jgi:flagellar protein FlaJ
MAAISGSMVDPSRIFEIIIKTEEYPHIKKEFIKVLNQINIYGYDLVSALRICASKTPSKKLAELFNGLAINISSGGDLPTFFDKRSQSLLFDYRLEREKATRSAETFMDIYISVVIAAPMILMLLLMMMKISGFGVSLSTEMITLIMILGVSGINLLFLTLLHLKQSEV